VEVLTPKQLALKKAGIAPRYRHLEPWQIDLISNGCGGKGTGWAVPDWVFSDDCDHHDVNYFIGCSSADRARADRQFQEASFKSVSRAKFFFRPWLWAMGRLYFRGVRQMGALFFHFAEKPRGWVEIEAHLVQRCLSSGAGKPK
jgi:hypothetical protein